MRRRHKRGTRSWRYAKPNVDPDALDINWDRAQARLGEQQLAMGQEVAGIFDPHLIARCQQDPDGDIDRVLGTRCDDDLLGLASHRARGPEIVAKASAQFDEPARVRVAKILRAKGEDRLMGQLAPNFYGTGVDEGAAGVEPIEVIGDGEVLDDVALPRLTTPR
jgi:hypothetical protein